MWNQVWTLFWMILLILYRVVAFTETGVSDKDTVGNFAPDLTFMEMDIAHGMTAR